MHYMQNSAFEQSMANTWTNNKTYLQLLIQKRQIHIAMSELTFLLNTLRARFTKLIHKMRCTNSNIWVVLFCCKQILTNDP